MENKIKIMKNGGKLKIAALIAAAAVAAAGGFYFLNTREGEIQ